MALYVAYFGVNSFTFSPSMCLDNIKLDLGDELLIRSYVLFILCLFVVLVVSRFGFEFRTLVMIAPFPVHCLSFTFARTKIIY